MKGRTLLRPATIATVLAMVCLGRVAQAREPIILAPTGKWQLNYNKTTCTLARQFGTGKALNVLIFEQFGPTADFQLTIISDEFRAFQQGTVLWQQAGAGDRMFLKNVLPGKSGKVASLFISSDTLYRWPKGKSGSADDERAPPPTPSQEAAVTSMTFGFNGKAVTFQTGPMDKAFTAMRTCTDDLVKSWDLDPKQQSTLTQYAVPTTSPAHWLTPNDYPSGMLMAGKQAIVNFRLTLDATGKPTACEIQRAYSDKAFTDLTCSLLTRRARFRPALDAQGKPVPSFYIDTVKWIMQI